MTSGLVGELVRKIEAAVRILLEDFYTIYDEIRRSANDIDERFKWLETL